MNSTENKLLLFTIIADRCKQGSIFCVATAHVWASNIDDAGTLFFEYLTFSNIVFHENTNAKVYHIDSSSQKPDNFEESTGVPRAYGISINLYQKN